MIIKENRTDAYIGTVDLSDSRDMALVKNMRKMIAEANKIKAYGDRSMYVKLQGRGHRMGKRHYNQSLPLKFSKTADIYIYSQSLF